MHPKKHLKNLIKKMMKNLNNYNLFFYLLKTNLNLNY